MSDDRRRRAQQREAERLHKRFLARRIFDPKAGEAAVERAEALLRGAAVEEQRDPHPRPIPPRERPILFRAPMVRSLVEGRKTATRRVVGLRDFGASETIGYDFEFRDRRGQWNSVTSAELFARCPYGQGDRLWVRETWNARGLAWVRMRDGEKPKDAARYAGPNAWVYAATPPERWAGGWRPSIHMPRAASRLLLDVVSVGVERLHDITESDAEAEGVPRNWNGPAEEFVGERDGWLTPEGYRHRQEHPGDDCLDDGTVGGEPAYVFSAREAFALWWDALYSAGAWAANPWVWRVGFTRVGDGQPVCAGAPTAPPSEAADGV